MIANRRPSAHPTGILAALLLILSLIVAQGQSPAAADHSTGGFPNNVQWNMAGWVRHAGATTPADALASSILNSGRQLPVVVTVNEICTAQYDRLRFWLSSSGYSSDYYIATTRTGGCSWFGNAVFWLGGQHSGGNYLEQYNAQAASDFQKQPPSRRGLICGRAAFPSFSGCSTHLTTSENGANATTQDLQLGELVDWVGWSNACCAPTFLGGDLNMTRNLVNSRDGRLYAGFQEADLSFDRTTMANYNLKYDYLFVPRNSHHILHSAYIFTSPHSDHRVVVGYQGA